MSEQTGENQAVSASTTQPVSCGPDFLAEFNPLALTGEARANALADHNLPPEPNPETEQNLHDFWMELLSPPLLFDNARFIYAPPPERLARAAQNVTARSRQQSSLNWSGASLLAHDGRVFTDVMAKWKVPEPKVPNGGSMTDQYKSSCWVGLDGQRAYADSTLPQIGTEQSINKVSPTSGKAAAVWVQWWPLQDQIIPTLPVTFGDTVYCWLTAMSYTRVRCIIRVNSAGSSVLKRFCVDAPTYQYDLPPEIPHPAKISGATAQWITEAPTNITTGLIFPLPNYTIVEFEHCYALSADGPLAPYQVEPLIGPTLTRMYKVVGAPGKRVTISVAERPLVSPGMELNRVTTRFVG